MSLHPRDLIWSAGGRVFLDYGVLIRRTARSEEEPETFTRPSAQTYTDRDGVVRAAAANVLPVDWLDLDGDGVRETPVAVFHNDAQASAPYRYSPVARTGYLRFIERGSVDIAGATLLYVGQDDQTGARFYVESDGSAYRVVYNDGSSSIESVATGPKPTAGADVELLWIQAATGELRLDQAISGVWKPGVQSAALALPSEWPAATRHLSSKGNDVDSERFDLIADKEARGIWSWRDMRGAC